MAIKKDFIISTIETIKRIEPNMDEEDIKQVVTRMVKQRMKDPTIIMDNNVTGDGATITLTEMCNWIEKRNPVVSGNATFYCQPEELESPTSSMLRGLKKGRKAVKKEMFKYNPNSDEYAMLDLDQANKKVIMNAEYGGSGAPTAAFYTKYSPAATTLMAQSIITTMAAFFESYVGDNQKFFHVNECYDWMNKVLEKKDKVPKWVKCPTHIDVFHRIVKHFYMFDRSDYDGLKCYIENRSKDELIYLYYANNLRSFIKNHEEVIDLIRQVLYTLPNFEAVEKELPIEFRGKFESDATSSDVDKYNKWVSKVMFLDPYTVPDCIAEPMKKLRELLHQFIYVEYCTPDSIVKLNNHYRNTVLLVDTDSNIINADLFVSFIIHQIFPHETFGRKRLYNEMILVNILANMLDDSVAKLLDYYGIIHHMGPEARAELTMKNEFMFRRFFIMTKKKRYAASIVLREGNIMMPFKLEIKGMDFIKAGVTKDVTDRFTKMLEKHILFSEELELHALMDDLKRFEKEIYHDLKIGGMKYLKQQAYKVESGYKSVEKAWQLPVFRGSSIWNELYPSRKIYSLDRVNILKLITVNEQALEKIKNTFPNEYNMVVNKIYHSEKPEIRKAGLKVICIPKSVKKIPDWLIPLIDYDILISDVISSFRSVLDALNIEEMYYKTPNGDAAINSCLISL